MMKLHLSCIAFCAIVTLFASDVSAERSLKKGTKKGEKKKSKKGQNDPSTIIPMCTGSDPITNGVPFDFPQQLVHVNNTIIYQQAPLSLIKLNSFEWADASAGMVDINTEFLVDELFSNYFNPNGNPADWCDIKGVNFFRVTIYGMCMHKSDDEFMYIKAIMSSQLDDCNAQTKIPGVCRLLRLSKNAPGSWTEYQKEVGRGFEWLHDGEALGMRLFYSSCPDEPDEKFNKVKATFDV